VAAPNSFEVKKRKESINEQPRSGQTARLSHRRDRPIPFQEISLVKHNFIASKIFVEQRRKREK
jgi:hypothetical protein